MPGGKDLMKPKFCLPGLVLALTFLVLVATFACNPEPGPQHFPKLTVPPVRIKSGYFTVYNSLNGLPCNDIRSLLIFNPSGGSNWVIVGTAERGLMIFADEAWHLSGGGLFSFPELTVTALAPNDENSFYAGTSAGIFKGTFSQGSLAFNQVAADFRSVINVNAMARNPDEKDSLFVAGDRTAGVLTRDHFEEFNIPEHLSPTGFSAVVTSDMGSFAGCNGGIFRISANGLEACPGALEKAGWVNSFAAAKNRLFIASSNGVLQLSAKEKVDYLLPGVWATCLAFSASPEDTLDGKDFKAFVGTHQVGAMLEDTDPFSELRGTHEQLQRDYAAYTRRFAGSNNVDPQVVFDMYQRFNDLQAAIENIAQQRQSEAIIAPLLKGLWIGTQDSGTILFATNGQRYHLTAANSKLPSDSVTAIACAPNGETWAGTANAGLLRYSSRSIAGKGKLLNLLECRPTRIRVLADLLAIGTKDDGMHLYDVKTLQSIGHYNPSSIKGFHKQVSDFAIDRDGSMWVTGDAGVMLWNGKAWQKIAVASGTIAPEGMASRVSIDGENRVFVAFAAPAKVCTQVCFFDGTNLVRTDPASVRQILQATDTRKLESVRMHGLSGVYMRDFNFGNASAALAAFENGDDSRVTAMLNTEHYLLTGLENGLQKIFDGESYKQLSEEGTGRIGAIGNLFRMPSGVILIQGADGISEFDGQHYKLLESPATGPGFKITDICLDQLNPETCRISFTSTGGGGYARYQEPFWEKFQAKKPVISIAQADPVIFLATPDGVDYLIE